MDILVVDTNIFINAIFSDRFKNDERIMELEENGFVRFAFSNQTKNELYRIVARKIEEYNTFDCAIFFENITEIISRSKFIANPKKLEKLSSDKGDQPFIELAVDIGANYLITNDFQNGLLELDTYRNVKISTPKSYLKLYDKASRRKAT
ncbi:putative toxin-antitoxin system toxin component, PIN family [Paenibacillus polymyxa]|uniref:putative toxin-antitoxin system toxin component, PIN family n=1 Tax=Paenibacillus polymyxa TaxID=1406 RepID=UPI002AB4BF44|nr:putative toxin-antitoxin system toxin component, PIN family [Paenibacillus polymyxa]MDY8023371.1 putative toxin-antitoxin system toxin component, PIN family [Paenibacillus polymyxa]